MTRAVAGLAAAGGPPCLSRGWGGLSQPPGRKCFRTPAIVLGSSVFIGREWSPFTAGLREKSDRSALHQ